MKFKISSIILILLSFFNIGAVSGNHMNINSFNELESVYINKSKFVENGSKIQYKTKNSINNELDRINRSINKNNIYNYEYMGENRTKFLDEDRQIETELWRDDKYTYVIITLVNSNENYKTEDLLSILKELISRDSEEIQYYRYYKGKISGDYENEYTRDISNSLSESKILNLSNGYTGSGYCTNGEKINFAISNYDTGAYIIIGTPIIFATY